MTYCSCGSRMRCLNNDEESLNWLVIGSAFWVGKKNFSARLAISPECVRCGDMEVSIAYAFFRCSVVGPLWKLLEGWMVCVLKGNLFVQETCSGYSNVVLSLNRTEHDVSLLPRHYESRDLDNTTGGILRRWVFLVSDTGSFSKAPN